MMDPAAAASLRSLFAARAGSYPHLMQEAEILFETGSGTKCRFKTKSPEETASLLHHIVNHEDGIFNRMTIWDCDGPLYFRMHKCARLGSDSREHTLLAFNFTFRESGSPSILWLSNPEMTDYYWQGDERIENKPPFTSSGPTLQETIAILRRAGNDWAAVNFMQAPAAKPALRLVQNNP